TRSITLGVVAIMFVIVIAMIMPLFLHRNQLFKKAENKAIDGSADWQGQQWQGKHSSWGEDRATSFNLSWGQSLQQASANEQASWIAASPPGAQSLSQLSTGASLPLLGNTTVASERQSPSAHFQQIALSYRAGSTPSWPKSRSQGLGSEMQA